MADKTPHTPRESDKDLTREDVPTAKTETPTGPVTPHAIQSDAGLTDEMVAQKSNQTMKTTLSLTSDPCGAERNVLRRIRLPSTVAETGEMPYGTTNVS